MNPESLIAMRQFGWKTALALWEVLQKEPIHINKIASIQKLEQRDGCEYRRFIRRLAKKELLYDTSNDTFVITEKGLKWLKVWTGIVPRPEKPEIKKPKLQKAASIPKCKATSINGWYLIEGEK